MERVSTAGANRTHIICAPSSQTTAVAGFSLLEIIIGTAVAAIIGVALFTVLQQTWRSEQQVSKLGFADKRFAILHERFLLDFSGIFLPKWEEKSGTMDQKDKQAVFEEEQITENRFFYATTEQADLAELTFVTANPLHLYGAAKPRLARVVYRLAPVAAAEDSFLLYRVESSSLVYPLDEENRREYVVSDALRHLSFTYFTLKNEEGQFFLEPHSRWNSDEQKQVEQQEGEEVKETPDFIKVTAELWEDASKQRSVTAELWYELFHDTGGHMKKVEIKREDDTEQQ